MIIGTYWNAISAQRTSFEMGWNDFLSVRKMLQSNRFLCIFSVLAILPLNCHFSPGWNRLFTTFSASFWINISIITFLKSFTCMIILNNVGWNEFLLNQSKIVFFCENDKKGGISYGTWKCLRFKLRFSPPACSN